MSEPGHEPSSPSSDAYRERTPEWKRVFDVTLASTFHEWTSVEEVAEMAPCDEDTAADVLDWMHEFFRYVEQNDDGEYRINERHGRFVHRERVREFSTPELWDMVHSIVERDREYREQFGVAAPEDVPEPTDEDPHEAWEAHSFDRPQWFDTRYNLLLVTEVLRERLWDGPPQSPPGSRE